MKELKYYIIFTILVVYHLLLKDWWTPALYYTGTYGIILLFSIDKFKITQNWNYIKLMIYFAIIYIYLMTSINKDVLEFYNILSIRKYALGFGGVGTIILMFFKRE